MKEIIVKINELLWGNFLLILLLGTGIFFTLKLNFVQIRKFSEGFKKLAKKTDKNFEAGSEGISPFQALATAIAAQVGTGNLAGAATAIVSGGPGAIFWMWLSAFFGMATVYAEAVLGQLFKTKVNGQITGGPAFYISKGLGETKFAKVLANIFAVACILALGFMGNAVQANSISFAFSNAFGTSPLIVGIIIAILSGCIFVGGIKRVAKVTEAVVPIMAGLYILACVCILAYNFDKLIPSISLIFSEAFSREAALGGVLGAGMKKAIRYGVSRGLFSNEAGMGSTPHAHAIAKVDHASEQGCVALLTVFIDTFIVLTCTALVILSSGVNLDSATGITLTQKAFEATLGNFGTIFIAIALLFFSLSTIIGWYFFGEANIRYLFKGTSISLNLYRALVMIIIVVGSVMKVDLVWELSDIFNGIMIFPNLIAIIALSSLVKENMQEYENQTSIR
ncbi:MAG: alanine/glycine:cation symporter family protein [Fusobacteriaceae bacterium]